MNITCPNCALKFPLIAGMADADARRVVALIGEVPPELASLVLEYLSLFKPPKTGLTWQRSHRLLGELVAGIKSAKITRKGRTWAAPQAHWLTALQDIIDRRHKFTLPLKSHGYLLEVLTGLADKAETEVERKTEQQRQQRPRQSSAHNAPTQALRADLRHFTKLYEMAPTDAFKREIERLTKQLERHD